MLFLDNKRITVQEIRDYEGDNEIILMLQKSYNELEEKFFSKNQPVRYKLGDKYVITHEKGMKEHKGAIFIPYKEEVKTKMGTHVVIYCENHFIKNGNPEYKPRGDFFDKQKVFNRNNIELALFYNIISSVINKGNKIILDDIEQKETEVANKRKKASVIEFYLYNEDSVLYNNSEKLIEIAYIFGISNPSKLSIDRLKNTIYKKIKEGEGAGDIKLVEIMKQTTPFYQSLIDIQKGLDKQVLKYEKNKWWFVAANKRKSEICSVNIIDDHKFKEILSAKLLMSPDLYESLRDMIEGIKENKKEAVKKKKETIMKSAKIEQKKIDERMKYKNTDFKSLKIYELTKICKVAKIKAFQVKKDLLIKKLEAWRDNL